MASSLDIDTAFIERLAELLQRNGLTEIEVCQGETRVRVAKQPPPVVEYVAAAPSAPHPAAGLAAAAAAAASPAAAPAAPEAPHPGTINSPMVGTVYLAPDPASPPYASVGDTVREGQTLLIIEAMKVMNAIRAPRAGRVARIFVENAAPVEYGEPLLVLE
jgi:acetyl-CoA carboxylase biotin carboxyl carrier protein